MKKLNLLILILIILFITLAGCEQKDKVKIIIKVPILSMECVTDNEIKQADQFRSAKPIKLYNTIDY